MRPPEHVVGHGNGAESCACATGFAAALDSEPMHRGDRVVDDQSTTVCPGHAGRGGYPWGTSLAPGREVGALWLRRPPVA